MAVMSDVALRQTFASGGIELDPPARLEWIKVSSLDLHLGPEAFLGTGTDIVELVEKRLLTIPPGELALVTTLEKVRVGSRYAAQIGLRYAFARKGLDLLAGPQIDPGFRGRLHVALVNLSPREIAIAYGEPLVTLVFHDLGADVGQPYGARAGDEYQEQDKITGGEIDDIRQHRGYALREVIREMATLSANVGELKTSVDGYIKTTAAILKRSDSYLRIFISTIGALVAAMIALVVWAIATHP